MVLAAKIFDTGLLRVAAGGTDDLKKLSEIPYLRRAGTCWETWWTYAPDLRRDLGALLHFRDGSAEALRALIDACLTARKGDDAEVASWFAKETPPRPFQYEAIHLGLDRERLCIGDSVGLGKTIEALGIMLGAFARGQIRRAVVCCPAGLRAQWFGEIQDKASSRTLPAAVKIAGGNARKQRLAIYRGSWQVLILSPNAVLNDREELARVMPTVGLTILDEASCIRNPGKTTDAILAVLRTRYRIALTATPIENALADLYSVMRWVDSRVFLSKKHFDARYVVWKMKHYKVKMKNGRTFTKKELVPRRYQNLVEVRAKLRPAFIRRTAEEVDVQLPRVIFTREILELGKRQREVYDLAAARAKKEVQGLEGKALFAPLVALRQACDSTELVAEGQGGKAASVKVERLRELLSSEFRGEGVLVFTAYERFVRIMLRDLREFNPVAYTGKMNDDDRRASLSMFRSGHRKLLIATNAAEKGHNLQVAGVVVNADLPWSPAALKQRVGRLRRMESKHLTIRMWDLVAGDTIEEKLILPKLAKKHRLFEEAIGDDELTRRDDDLDSESMAGLTADRLVALL